MKKDKIKELVIEQLKRTPIVQAVCEKIKVSRSTIYRWRSESKKFAEEMDEAILEGEKLINDLAESKLIASIQDQKIPAIVFWLKNRHEKYSPKLQISGELENMQNEMTPTQKKVVEQALKLSSLITEENIKKLNSIKQHEDKTRKKSSKEDS